MPGKNQHQDMGKKIADALKAQGEVEELFVDEVSADDFLNDANDDLSNLSDSYEIPVDSVDLVNIAELNKEDSTLGEFSAPMGQETNGKSDYVPIFKVDQNEINENPDMKLTIESEDITDEFEMPNNINVLRRLIGQLPSGVPRQTGAQIIRQTIEALGIPMRSVLQDAQKAKDVLNASIKDCTFTIQEYKANIRNLEKQSLTYQKQLTKLNDITGLFVYGDKAYTAAQDAVKKQ